MKENLRFISNWQFEPNWFKVQRWAKQVRRDSGSEECYLEIREQQQEIISSNVILFVFPRDISLIWACALSTCFKVIVYLAYTFDYPCYIWVDVKVIFFVKFREQKAKVTPL